MTMIRVQSRPAFPKSLFRGYSTLAVLMDENTKMHCYPLIKDKLPPHVWIEMRAGEASKNLATCQNIWQQFTDSGLDRHSLVIIVGGGVPGDLGAFCASTFKRGLDFILVPTTLLAMADSSIGGKTGIDFGSLKNHIGTFAPPVATWIATDFLRTLPLEELRSGFAEVIKHCLISDRRLWASVRQKPLDRQDWLKLVQSSVKFKSAVVRKDPKESGLRKILNYGHTMGHALEGYYLHTNSRLLHGDAVAAGMVLEGHIAFQKKLLTRQELAEISDYILGVFGKVELPVMEKLMPSLLQDKKNRGKKILMALPKHIGQACFDRPVSEREIWDAAAYYDNIQT
jgi:3-dehydroquinate synthase